MFFDSLSFLRTTDIRISAANIENIPPSNIPQELRSVIEMTNQYERLTSR